MPHIHWVVRGTGIKIETRLIDEKFESVTNFSFDLGRESRAAVVEESTISGINDTVLGGFIL
jgi:hypothetical protein